MMIPITAVAAVGMTVADMDQSIEFYTTVLDCQKISDREFTASEFEPISGLSHGQRRVVQLQLGQEQIELTEFITAQGRPIPSDSRSNDCWFQHIAIVVSNMERAYQHLRQQQVMHTSPIPQTLPAWNPVAGGIQSFYFQDPDGHNLELIHFPVDKGNPKWQGDTASLFMGIDHTAIVVTNTVASLAFYGDLLGMELQQTSHNWGIEQERLSGVEKAQVNISNLQAATGLGIELLEYVQPLDGRPLPTDTDVNDLWHWQTMVILEDSIALETPQHRLIQDPDGHYIRLIKKSSK
jgi:catechol 2,3-dioxygenase-like lactoylglutathione lyase family enzyme